MRKSDKVFYVVCTIGLLVLFLAHYYVLNVYQPKIDKQKCYEEVMHDTNTDPYSKGW